MHWEATCPFPDGSGQIVHPALSSQEQSNSQVLKASALDSRYSLPIQDLPYYGSVSMPRGATVNTFDRITPLFPEEDLDRRSFSTTTTSNIRGTLENSRWIPMDSNMDYNMNFDIGLVSYCRLFI